MPQHICSKICNTFFVYLPVLLLTLLILADYVTYIFTYLKFMLIADAEEDKNDFFLNFTTAAKNAKAKGNILLYLSLFLITMLFISMFKAVFSNPGYFPSPLELEYKILSI